MNSKILEENREKIKVVFFLGGMKNGSWFAGCAPKK